MKNIVMLLDNGFDPDIRVYKEAKYLVEHQKNVEIVCLDRKNQYKDKEIEEIDGIKIKRIFCRKEKTTNKIEKSKLIAKFKGIIYFWWLLKFIYQAKKYLNNKEFEILHCHDLIMAFIGCIFFYDKKIIFDMHEYYGDNKNKFKNYIIKRMVSYIQNKSYWIIYVNDYQKQNCSKNNKKKLVEIPNYPEIKSFTNAIKTKSDKIRISYIGKIRDFNSLSQLIDADVDEDKIEIAIYGDGSAYEELLKYAKEKHKESIIKGSFNGVKDVKNIYNDTDILFAVYDINSKDGVNWKNAMPIKSFEAIITLTPIIASKNTVLGNFVEENNIGFTIDITQEKEIDKLIKNILSNSNLLKEKANNMKKIQYLYTWDSVIRNIDKIYLNNEKN